MITFSENPIVHSGAQDSVIQPPETIMQNGFVPTHKDGKGMSLPANWLNWFFREIFRLFNRDIVSNETGKDLFKTDNAAIELIAFDRQNSTRFIHAVGFKPVGALHELTIISSNEMTLGTPTLSGDQPVNGGTETITIGKSRS